MKAALVTALAAVALVAPARAATVELAVSIAPAPALIIEALPARPGVVAVVIADGRFIDPAASTGWTVRIDAGCTPTDASLALIADGQAADADISLDGTGATFHADPGHGNGAYVASVMCAAPASVVVTTAMVAP